MAAPIVLSASQIHNHDDCRRKHWYASVAKVKTAAQAANLTFGKCVDVAVRDYLMAVCLGDSLPDPVEGFERRWRDAQGQVEMTYSASQTPEDMEQIGRLMLEAFPARWEETGLTVAMDATGQPMLDRRFRVALGEGLFIIGIMDLGVYTALGQFGVVDVKTGASEPSEQFTRRSDQLTTYQLLVDKQDVLGLPVVERLGFLTLLKRKKTPRIELITVDSRSPEEVRQFVQKCKWIAEDIRRGRFDRASRLAFNNPCSLCDYAAHCIDGVTEGLIFREGCTPDRPAIAA